MKYPPFFDDVATITLYDPLAKFLGAAEDGMLVYRYVDAVKLAGHSCPTVAGAYLMTLKALASLYGEQTPQRGDIRIDFRNAFIEGVTGVIANVAGLLTGAAGAGGFKGIAGRFDRRNLLFFEAGMEDEIRFTRMDNGASVDMVYHPELVPAPSELKAIMPKVLSGEANDDEQLQFAELWQVRVKRILIDNFDNPDMIRILPVGQ